MVVFKLISYGLNSYNMQVFSAHFTALHRIIVIALIMGKTAALSLNTSAHFYVIDTQ